MTGLLANCCCLNTSESITTHYLKIKQFITNNYMKSNRNNNINAGVKILSLFCLLVYMLISQDIPYPKTLWMLKTLMSRNRF